MHMHRLAYANSLDKKFSLLEEGEMEIWLSIDFLWEKI